MSDTSLVIVAQDSPDRCSAVTSKGQCINRKQDNHECCAMHSRAAAPYARRKSIQELYTCTHTARINEFASAGGPSGIMGLAAEVSILRTTLEAVLASCKTQGELVLNMGPISDLASKIAAILGVMDRINMNSGNLLGPEEMLQLANEIIQVIATVVTDPETQQQLSFAISQVFKNKFAPGVL